MLISIGILAWNEERNLEVTLTSLFRQTALQPGQNTLSDVTWEIIVVPNGCTDNTGTIAREVLKKLAAQSGNPQICFAVHELAEAGKSNAWNHYIHEFSSKDAEFILMIDADIEFGENETIENTVNALLKDDHALVAVDMPLKDVVRKRRKTILEWISVSASGMSSAGAPAISGQYFCSRSFILRQIWMPKGMSVEDGFLRAMIVTNCMRSPVDVTRIIRAENATHYFETLTSIKSIFKHELRIVIGTALNCYFIWDFLYYATDPDGPGAGVLIRNRTQNDPAWYPSLLENSIRNRGFWVLPKGMIYRRFSKLRHCRGFECIKNLFVVIAGFMLDFPVFIVANRRLKKRSMVGFW